MSELKVYVPQDGPYGLEPEEGGKLVEEETCYLKSDVDAVIAEKDRALEYAKALTLKDIETIKEKDKEIAELKQKLEDAGVRERRLRRALYKACANWAINARMVEIESGPWGENRESLIWASVYDKCLKKAEEYK